MNKAVTEGLILMPPPFSEGLQNWSSGNGTPGSPSYDGAGNAAFVPSDPDFGGCLEILKNQSTQRLRWFGQTPILPGLFLRVRVRIKALSGALPTVRIAGFAANPGGGSAGGVAATGPETTLQTYGDVVTVSAIIATGPRGGVDMNWAGVAYGHLGIDLTGPNGGLVRIDDVQIEDVTGFWLRDLMDWVDVRDFGAAGDGVTDDRDAFLAADAAAMGRQLLVSEGSYRIGANLTLNSPVRFEGTLVMTAATRLMLTTSYDFPTYAAAFGDQDLGFRKALQALFYFVDHVTLDLKGRRVRLTAPIDVQGLTDGMNNFEMRRVITNGQIEVIEGPAWASQGWSRQATYSPSDNERRLNNVSNVAAIPVGARVTGSGVGREIYVTGKNEGAGTLTLSQPLFDAEGTQSYSFTRDRYVLDFSGFAKHSKLELTDIEFLLKGAASGVMLAPEGLTTRVADCVFNAPKDRAITSPGRGCQGMFVDQCQFLSNEMQLRAQDRTSVALNINANDAKIRNNRVVLFAAFCVAGGSGHLFIGNHFFHGDSEPQGIRQAGLVLAQPNVKTTITGNYVDNCFIEWTNEYSSDPSNVGFSFGGLTVTGNIFTANGVAPWFRWFTVTPYGPGQFINGLNLSGNVFRTINGQIERVESVNTTYADLNYSMFRNIQMEGNAYNGIQQMTVNPVALRHNQGSAATVWTISPGAFLPFGGRARSVTSIVPDGVINGPGSEVRSDFPFATTEVGTAGNQVRLTWPTPARGRVLVTVRVDNQV